MKKISKRLLIMSLIFSLVLSVFTIPSIVKAQNRIDNLIENMSTQEKVTQLLMPDFRHWQQEGQAQEEFTVMNDEVEEIIDTYDFGGVILFAQNVQETEQTARLTYSLQEAALLDNDGEGNSIPLFISIDQEGGIVYRLGTGTALPGNMAVGATKSPEYARNVGEIIGRELSSLGINVNHAPVMDVNNNPRNSVIGLRSYSDNPDLVAELGVATIQGLKEYNVSGSAKHFPGHGDTTVDSHLGLPEVDKSLEELMAMELVPFQAAMNEGIDMIMTAHMMFPQLDSEHPATLSHNILTGLVRNTMDYEGVIITDAMNMAAIADNYGEIDASKQAIYSGVDIVLMPTILRNKEDVVNKLDPMIEELVREAENEPVFMDRLNESVERVLKLKEERGILDYASNKPSLETKVNNALEQVGSRLNRGLERQISRDAVTVIKNDDHVLPFNMQSEESVLLVGAYANEIPGMEFSMRRLINEGVLPSDIEYESVLLRNGTTERSREEIRELLADKDYVVIISEVGNERNLNPENSWVTRVPMAFTEEASDLGVESVIMSVSKPYDTVNYPEAQGVIAVYGAKGMDPTEGLEPSEAFGPNIPAGIEIIFGADLAKGTLPVNLPALNENYEMTGEILYSYGHGLTLNEPADSISLQLPSETSTTVSFELNVQIGELAGITSLPYAVFIELDTDNFELDEEQEAEIEMVDGGVLVSKEANDFENIVISIKALNEGNNQSPVTRIDLIDAKERVFSHGDGYFSDNLISVELGDAHVVDQLIAQFKEADEVTEEYRAKVMAAREAYEALTEEQKALVHPENIGKLERAEDKIDAADETPSQQGWVEEESGWYYYDENGAMQTGWTRVKGTWYYLNDEGLMQTGWTQVNNTWYYLDNTGAMQTGWTQVNNTWYYLASSGAMQTGWTQVNNTWYYLAGSGAMQTGWMQVNNTWYYLAGSGAMQTGWTQVNNTWYYLDNTGAMQTGWLKLGNDWYYLNTDGSMQIDNTTINGVWYQFDGSGRML